MPVSRREAVAVSRAPPVAARPNKHGQPQEETSETSKPIRSRYGHQSSVSTTHFIKSALWVKGTKTQVRERMNESVWEEHTKNKKGCMCLSDMSLVCEREIIRWKKRWPWMHSVSSYGVWVALVTHNHLASHFERSSQPLCIGDLHPFKITEGSESAFRIIPLQRKIILILNSDSGFFISYYVRMSGSPTKRSSLNDFYRMHSSCTQNKIKCLQFAVRLWLTAVTWMPVYILSFVITEQWNPGWISGQLKHTEPISLKRIRQSLGRTFAVSSDYSWWNLLESETKPDLRPGKQSCSSEDADSKTIITGLCQTSLTL